MMAPLRDRPGVFAAVDLGEAEVGDLGLAVERQEDVRRLEVAVDDPVIVGDAHGPGEGLDELRGLADRERAAAQLPLEAAAVDVLHDEVGEPVPLADLVDLHEVGVREAGHRLHLGAEPGQLLRVGARPAWIILRATTRFERALSSPVDDAHAPLSQLLEDLQVGRGRLLDPGT